MHYAIISQVKKTSGEETRCGQVERAGLGTKDHPNVTPRVYYPTTTSNIKKNIPSFVDTVPKDQSSRLGEVFSTVDLSLYNIPTAICDTNN